jgi:hypothetical protein
MNNPTVCESTKQFRIENPESPMELAKRWNVPISWVYNQTRLRGPGSIPRIKMGKYTRFIPTEVDAWALATSTTILRNGRGKK